MPRSRRLPAPLLAFMLVAAVSASLLAQRPESATSKLFPTAERVYADFPDDAQKWAALTALYGASMERLPDGTYKASYEKSSNYRVNINLLEQQYSQAGQSSSKAKEFFDRVESLRNDKAFRLRVLDKYGISKLPTGSGKPPASEPVVGKTGEELVQEAAPYWLGTIILMWLVARQVVRTGGSQSVPAVSAGGDLPANLQIVDVTARRYPVELESGVVLEEKTWTETTTTFSTTPGQVVTVGDQTYQTAPTHSTSVSSTRKDRIWMRDAAGRETAWMITGGVLEARTSHVLSRIGRPVGDDVMFLMACNHTTGQMVSLDGGIHAQHFAPFLRAWIAATLVGTAGFLFGGWNMIPLINDTSTFEMKALGLGIEGLIGSTIMGFFMAFLAGRSLTKRRNNEFYKNWVPKYREFFRQFTPAVMAKFR